MNAKKKAKTATGIKISHYDVVRKPVVTEKSTQLSEHNKIVFDVAKTADKAEIKAAIEAIFGVKVKAVNTLLRKGKTKGFRGTNGRQSDVKKAIVTLAEGQSLDIASGAR